MTMTDRKPVSGSFTIGDTDPEDFHKFLFGYPTRATQIKDLWDQCVTHWPDQVALLPLRPYGWIMNVPDPQDISLELTFEKIAYGDTDVIEAEGVIVCRL